MPHHATCNFHRVTSFQKTLAEKCADWNNKRKQKLKKLTPSLDFFMQCALDEPEKFEADYRILLGLGRNEAALYPLLQWIYASAFGHPISVDGGEVRLEAVGDFAACQILPVDHSVGFFLSEALGKVGRKDRIQSADKLEHRLPYDIQSKRVPEFIKNLYGGDVRGGEVWAMKNMSIRDGAMALNVGSANYGLVVDTCDSLVTESYLLAALVGPELAHWEPADALACLPWREQLHREEGGDLAKVLLRPTKRAAGLGLSCLTAFKPESSPPRITALWAKRGKNVAVLSDIFHVVPAGMCSCMDGANLHEDDLRVTLYKEFLEELFDDKTAETLVGRTNICDHVMRHIEQKLFTGDPDHSSVIIHQTGFAIDLTNLRPEICLINIIENELVARLLVKHRHPNWENESLSSGQSTPTELGHTFAPKDWVQSGAVAWKAAKDYLHSKYFPNL